MSISVEQFQDTTNAIIQEIGKVIVGQEEVIRHVLICVITGRHVLLEGVPGLGKTMLIRTLGDVLKLDFSRIQFTPDLMPADIVGTDILEENASGQRHFRFQPWVERKGSHGSHWILQSHITTDLVAFVHNHQQ